MQRIYDSTVKVYNEVHGLFTVNSRAFELMYENIVSSVNFDGQGRRVLAAALSEATEINYFDADLTLIVAALVSCNFDTWTVTALLADKTSEWVSEVYDRYAPTGAALV